MNRSFFSRTKHIGVGLKKNGSHIRSKITPKLPPGVYVAYESFSFLHYSLH